MTRKQPSKKVACKKTLDREAVIDAEGREIIPGELVATRPRLPKQRNLISAVAEKIPFLALSDVCKHAKSQKLSLRGVYVAHDSMGYPRYIGRGNIKTRLKSRLRAHPEELRYFSFYLIGDACHEREVETLLIHIVGSLLDFNDRKRRTSLEKHAIKDFEAGTKFYELR